jgi:hypothetical protein
MGVRLFARGSDGIVAITNGDVDQTTLLDYVNNPLKNINNVFFHSNFQYMSLHSKFTASITLPQRTKQTQTDSSKKGGSTYDIPDDGTQRYLLGYHGLGYIPFATSSRGSEQVTPTAPIQNSGASTRMINIEMDETNIYVFEYYVTYQYTLSAITDTYTAWVFRNPA